MASPAPSGPAASQGVKIQPAPTNSTPESDGPAAQFRPMGLKVHYTFDVEAKVKCLARCPYTINVQTIKIDETTSIGIVDLRACIQAITECSPELATQDCDYTVYALDYTEPDTPLVGQGMLSWVLESMRGDVSLHQPKLVTGRVTKNVLGVFAGGNKETLETRIKLSSATKVQRGGIQGSVTESQQQQHRPTPQQRQQSQGQPAPHQQPPPPQQHSQKQHLQQEPQPQPHHLQIHPQELQQSQQQRSGSADTVMTPTGTAEWNSFLQSNPQVGQPNLISRVASPAFPQDPSLSQGQDSLGSTSEQHLSARDISKVAPTLVDSTEIPAASSRPSSRASNRPRKKRPPTGRPRGRPRKKPAEGNTSGYEDGTEGEDGPAKKRVKTTMVEDKSASNPFATDPESLRVAASTAGSLRNFRPVGTHESVAGDHVQEIPRAPTPVPNNPLGGFLTRGSQNPKMRRESTLSRQPMSNYQPNYAESRPALSPSQDGRSPESQGAPTPSYSHDSPVDIGSSPPVQLNTPFIRSSPPPSSPVLPPMPPNQLPDERSFEAEGMDDLFGNGFFEPIPDTITAPRPTRPTNVRNRKPSGSIDSMRVPEQVFRLMNGPSGQDMVHIASYNTPHPNYNTPLPSSAAHLPTDPPSLPILKNDNAQVPSIDQPDQKQSRPPTLALTPPSTTDAAEKAISSSGVAEAMEISGTPGALDSLKVPNDIEIPDAPQVSDAPELPDARELSNSPAVSPVVRVSPEAPERNPESPVAPQVEVDSSTESAQHLDIHLLSTFTPVNEAPPQEMPEPQLPPPQPFMSKPPHPRKFGRSQSAGPLALPTVPASEPVGPSSLSQSMSIQPEHAGISAPSKLKRSASIGPLCQSVPASDPIQPTNPSNTSGFALPQSICPPSDLITTPSSPVESKANKNFVKKHAIKQRLEAAILNGEMPPFCSNCGAIETPTWRKIWVQDHEGVPNYCEYSEKPGRVTTIEILTRDEEEKPLSYRFIKKGLGPKDDKDEWQELLHCNPCGIWLSKCKSQRPPDRWEKDASRLGQERRRRGTGRSASRPKKGFTIDGAQFNPTSEAYLPTDALGSVEPSSPKPTGTVPPLHTTAESQQGQEFCAESFALALDNGDPPNPASPRLREDGTAKSPIDVEFDQQVGTTKRLLFPSPRKDGSPKVLCELDVNIVQTPDDCRQPKEATSEKENVADVRQHEATAAHDDLEDLFGSPIIGRPSTPPPNTKASALSGPFKTPTRPTPSHRPVTRSVSRSLRSIRGMTSPAQLALLQRTPSKTPTGGSGRKRSPRNNQVTFDVFDTPISRTIHQLLSEPNGFALGDHDLDLGSLPTLEGHHSEFIDFGNLLSTDGVMPSSPPRNSSLGFDYGGSANVWAQWHMSMDSELNLDSEVNNGDDTNMSIDE